MCAHFMDKLTPWKGAERSRTGWLPTSPTGTSRPRWTAAAALGALVAGGILTDASPAEAQETVKPPIMLEPGDVVDVIDAFDDDNGDPFDIQVTLGFQYLSKRARIMRESAIYTPGLTTGGYTSKLLEVGQYVETTSRLTPRLDIGLYKDLAIYTRIPIVLSNSRRIDEPDEAAGNIAAVTGGAPGETLFTLPFQAPDRSGVEYVAVGLDLGIFNQARDRTKPTWILGAEARISAGEPMSACNVNPASGEIECAHEGDINRNGTQEEDPTDDPAGLPNLFDEDGRPLESEAIEERGPGITRGTVGLEIHTLMSKRLKYIEPYGGFKALFEFQQSESGLDVTDAEGVLVNHPPIIGTVMVGMMIHPWENREKFGRLTFDVRFEGEYHSEGRDYGELYDALGSSNAPSLRHPKWERYEDACPDSPTGCDPKSVIDQGSAKTYFTGMAVIEPYGSYRASSSVTWRAAEYVKLNFGLGLRFDQAHGISHDQPCNPDFQDNVGESGPCHSELGGGAVSATGVPNPAYRPTINAIGRRFFVDESITYEIFANGIVMF